MPTIEAGKKAPEILLHSVTGEEFSLSNALQRGPVFVAFFKITCPVCQYAFPYYERLYQAFRKSDVTFVGISQNDEEGTEQFMREYGVTFPVLLDDPNGYKVSNAYGLTIVPTWFLINEDGMIEASSVGWSKADLEAVVRTLSERSGGSAQPLFKPGEEVAEWRPG